MAGEWQEETVIDLQRRGVLLVEDGNHGEYRPRPDEFVESGIAFVRAADMDAGRVLFESSSRISEIARQRIRKGIGAPGDVLLSHKGTVGKVALVLPDAPPFVCSPQTTFWRTLDEEQLERRYLYAFLRSREFRAQLATRSGETDMAPYVSLTSQRGLSVILPPIDVQRAIGHVLGTLDDKIELNRRMNETLEAMARALFKSWFVDFDPVRAKAKGRDLGLPKALADLFPDSFDDSELGEVPKGWEVASFNAITEELRHRENPLDSPDELYQHFSIPAYDDGLQPKSELGETIKSQKSHVPSGVVLLSKLNPEIPRVWLVDVSDDDRAVCSTEFLVLRPNEPFGRSFLYCLCKSPVFRQKIESLVTGTSKSHQRARPPAIFGLRVTRPSDNLIEAFEQTVVPLLSRTQVGRRECCTLAGLRDTLLPKLISGELRVKGPTNSVGRVI